MFGFTVFYTVMFITINITFLAINIRFINQTIAYQNDSLVEMMEHLIEETDEATALIFLEHYGHTHQVYLEYIGLISNRTLTTHVPPSDADQYTIYYQDTPYAILKIDHMVSSITRINTTYLITLNSIFIGLFILGFVLLQIYIRKQHQVIINDFKAIKKRIHTLSHYNQYYFSELSEIDETFTNTLETIEKLKDAHHQKIQVLLHDIKTPLTIIKSTMEMIESKRLKLDDKQIQSLKEEIDYIDQLLPKIIHLDIEDTSIEQNITQIISEQIETIKPLFEKQEIKVIKDLNQNIRFKCQSQDIKRIIDHLLSNVYHYAKNATKVIISLKDNPMTLTIEDNGEGFTEEALNRFSQNEPNHSKKGTGLGLLMVKQIVKKYEGDMHISSTKNKTIITIKLSS